MEIHIISSKGEYDRYDQWLKTHPEGNLWQSLERKQYLETLRKEVHIYVAEEQGVIIGSALIMIDTTSFGVSTWDIPRGPIGEQREELIEKIVEDAKEDKCLAVYYSPLEECKVQSAKFSSRMIHCEATRIIDLTQSEKEILAQMKQKGRYNIRIAEKHDVRVKKSDDIDAYYQLAKKTGERDQYKIVSKQKYDSFLKHLPGSFLLLAYQNNEPIAGVLGVFWGRQAIYYYGASDYAHRASMAPYLLQWESIKKAKAAGCVSYDLLGIAPEGAGNHPWDGISSFKEKFGGEVVEYPAEKMIVLRPVVKGLLEMKRGIWK
jgi:lipid II:glycine glycyltransferase (peptidoglycan interpeptide bridge formation enzyme)